MVSFVVAMNRVDVVDLVVDLVDVDLDVDLVDVVSLSSGCIFIFWPLGPQLYFCLLAPGSIFAFWPPAVPAVFFPGCFWRFPVVFHINFRGSEVFGARRPYFQWRGLDLLFIRFG